MKIPLNITCFCDTSLFSKVNSEFLPGKIIMLSWREGRLPVFDFLFDRGGLYCDLPISCFNLKGPSFVSTLTNDQIPFLSPQIPLVAFPDSFWIGEYEPLKEKPHTAFYGPNKILSHNATYLVSLELDKNYELYHFIALESGALAMVPNNTLMMGYHTSQPAWGSLQRDFSLVPRTSPKVS